MKISEMIFSLFYHVEGPLKLCDSRFAKFHFVRFVSQTAVSPARYFNWINNLWNLIFFAPNYQRCIIKGEYSRCLYHEKKTYMLLKFLKNTFLVIRMLICRYHWKIYFLYFHFLAHKYKKKYWVQTLEFEFYRDFHRFNTQILLTQSQWQLNDILFVHLIKDIDIFSVPFSHSLACLVLFNNYIMSSKLLWRDC